MLSFENRTALLNFVSLLIGLFLVSRHSNAVEYFDVMNQLNSRRSSRNRTWRNAEVLRAVNCMKAVATPGNDPTQDLTLTAASASYNSFTKTNMFLFYLQQ